MFSCHNVKLKLLSAKNLVESVKEYVEKGEREAIEEVVTCSVSTVQTVLKKKPLTDLSEDISEEIERSREELQACQEEEGQKTIQVPQTYFLCEFLHCLYIHTYSVGMSVWSR